MARLPCPQLSQGTSPDTLLKIGRKGLGRWSSVLQFSLLASAALSALLFVSAGWISQALSGTHTWTQLFQILALTSFYAMLFPQVGGFLQGLQRIREIATISLMNTVVERSAVLYLLYHLPLHMKLYGVVYG